MNSIKHNLGKFIVIIMFAAGCLIVSCIVYGVHYYYTCGYQRHCPQTETVTRGGIRATLWSKYSYYEIGETIHIRYSLQNVSSNEIILENPLNEPAFDVRYRDEDGNLTYWSRENPQLAVSRLELRPNDKIEVEIKMAYKKTGIYFFEATVSGVPYLRFTVNYGLRVPSP